MSGLHSKMEEELKLIRQFQAGSSDGFSLLYDKYVEKIYNFIYYRTHHKETAEDLTSLVFTKMLENIGSFNVSKGTFNSWLYQIARNSIIDHYRTFKTSEDIETAFDIASNLRVERDADIAMQMENVQKLLQNFPKDAREVVVMRVWDGLSYKEISEITGKSEASLKMLFSRTISKLQGQIPTVLFLLFIIKNNLHGQ